jgi:hypothetical protein
MPARWASWRIASTKVALLMRMKNVNTSPPVAQAPKQRHVCLSGKTKKEGVLSA